MKKVWKVCLICFLVLLTLASCGSSNDGSEAEPGTSGNNQVVVETDRKIIYTVDYSLISEDVNQTIKKYMNRSWLSKDGSVNHNSPMMIMVVMFIKSQPIN